MGEGVGELRIQNSKFKIDVGVSGKIRNSKFEIRISHGWAVERVYPAPWVEAGGREFLIPHS